MQIIPNPLGKCKGFEDAISENSVALEASCRGALPRSEIALEHDTAVRSHDLEMKGSLCRNIHLYVSGSNIGIGQKRDASAVERKIAQPLAPRLLRSVARDETDCLQIGACLLRTHRRLNVDFVMVAPREDADFNLSFRHPPQSAPERKPLVEIVRHGNAVDIHPGDIAKIIGFKNIVAPGAFREFHLPDCRALPFFFMRLLRSPIRNSNGSRRRGIGFFHKSRLERFARRRSPRREIDKLHLDRKSVV